jgi:hypothetical protein
MLLVRALLHRLGGKDTLIYMTLHGLRSSYHVPDSPNLEVLRFCKSVTCLSSSPNRGVFRFWSWLLVQQVCITAWGHRIDTNPYEELSRFWPWLPAQLMGPLSATHLHHPVPPCMSASLDWEVFRFWSWSTRGHGTFLLQDLPYRVRSISTSCYQHECQDPLRTLYSLLWWNRRCCVNNKRMHYPDVSWSCTEWR